ncbi:DUF320 domain-containing protein [Actinoallomurus spadix]|uniref:Chaplin domain-containing protein n=1 Tax=Actinoallomurus spadix TaxID=79912 RepID=A0ABP3G7J5_9ACTN|nr:chaplin family protein [Actinoallomurus spadix]MCO5987428.1 DUF320 domain-containing protein [Actinoallomurus spadix]
MPTWAKSTARATLLTASFVALGAGPALADVTDGSGSVLGGNQIKAPVSAPVNVSGNAVAVIGHALAGSAGGASVHRGAGAGGGRQSTSGRHSIGGGNQVNIPITAPINVCGNAVGNAIAGCEGGASVTGPATTGGGRTNGRHSIGGGNQVTAPITAPVDICGNAVAVIGHAAAGCAGVIPPVRGGSTPGGRTNGRHSVGGGNQVTAPITAPINACGNAVAVIGHALAGCVGGASVSGGHGHHGGHGGHGGHHCVSPQHAMAARAPQNELPAVPDLPSTGTVAGDPASLPSVTGPALQPARRLSAPATSVVPGSPRLPVAAPMPRTPQDASFPVSGRLADAAGAVPGAVPALPDTTGLAGPVNAMLPGSGTSETAAGTAKTGAPVDPGVAGAVPGARALPNLPRVPDTRSIPAAGAALPVPARPGLPPVSGSSKEIPAMRTVAAQGPDRTQRGALAALALAALLAASSGAVAMVRRFRDR